MNQSTTTSNSGKPHKGIIDHWYIEEFNKDDYPDLLPNLGYVIRGVPWNHPEFANCSWIRTSAIVKHDGNEVETLNSRYTLGEPKREPLG